MPKRLLVVDGDPKTLRVLDVGLRQAGFDVHAVASASVALTLVEQITPDLIIVDPDNSSGPGLELIQRFVQRIGGKVATPVIVMGKERGRDARLRAFDAGAADYVPKPPFVQEVVMRVNAVLQQTARERLAAADETSDARWNGALGNLGIVDLLQLLDETKQSGLVHLRRSRAGSATMYFRQGRLVDAEVGRLSGSDALYRLFSWPDGEFDFEAKSIRRKDAINQPTGQLLLEGLKQLDEWHRLVEQLPSLTAVFEVDYKLLAERLAGIPDEVNGILRLFDGVRTVAQVIEDCPLSDLEALTAITRLYGERIIYETKDDAVPRGSSSAAGLDVWLSDATAPFGIARARARSEGGSDLLVVGTTAFTAPPNDAAVKATTASPGSGAVHSFAERLASEVTEPPADPGAGPSDASSLSERTVPPAIDPGGSTRARRSKRGAGGESSSRRPTHPGIGGGALGAAAEAKLGQRDDEISAPIPDVAPSTDLSSAGAAQESAVPSGPAAFASSPRDGSPHAGVEDAQDRDAGWPAHPESDYASALVEPAVPGKPPMLDNLIRFPGPSAAISRDDRDNEPVLAASELLDDEQTPTPAGGSGATAGLIGAEAAPLGASPERSDAVPGGDRTDGTGDQGPAGEPKDLSGSSADSHPSAESLTPPQAERTRIAGDGTSAGVATLSDFVIEAPEASQPAAAPSVFATQRGIGPERAGTARPPALDQDPPLTESRALADAEGGAGAGPTRPSRPISQAEAADELGLGSRRGTRALLAVAAGVLAVFGGIAAWRLTRAPKPADGRSSASVAARADRTDPAGAPTSAATAPRGHSGGPAERSSSAPTGGRPAVVPGREAASAAPAVDLPRADTRSTQGSASQPTSARAGPAAQVQASASDGLTGTAAAKSVVPVRETPMDAMNDARLLDHCRSAFAGGRMRDARAACASAAGTDPKSAEARVLLAHAELNLGRPRQALEHARKAVALDPGLADAYVIIGGVQQELGNTKDAKTAYLRYLQLAPRGRYADDLRAIVQSL